MKLQRGRMFFWIIFSMGILGVVLFASTGAGNERASGGSGLSNLLNGDNSQWITILFVVGIAAVTMIPFFRVLFPAKIKNGVATQAKVLKVWDTGTTVNNNPQVGLLLEYALLGSSTVQAEARTLVSRIQVALVQPGITAEILYDPNKPSRVQIKTLHIPETPVAPAQAAAPAPQDLSDRLEELNDMHTKNLITEEEYQQKRQEILKSL